MDLNDVKNAVVKLVRNEIFNVFRVFDPVTVRTAEKCV
jgi:hypothetical protein